MLDRAINATPATIKHQILDKWNSIFQNALNQSLNHEIVGPDINYSFDHVDHGKINISFVHHNYGYGVTQENGM